VRAEPRRLHRDPIAGGADAEARRVVVDTDLAFDDIMALLYLLQRDDVVIDGVTIEASCIARPGARCQ
jgi:hypothetical protein